MQAQTMALQSIGVYIKRENVAGVPDEIILDERILGVTGVPVSGGGVGATFEASDSALIYPDLMGSPSVVTKMSSNTSLETEYSGSPIILELLGGFLYSYASKAVADLTAGQAINRNIGHRINEKETVTITDSTPPGAPIKEYTITAQTDIFGAPANPMRVVKYQWLWMDGFATAQTLRNNRAIQVHKYVSASTIVVRQPLMVATDAPNITFTGSMFRNGVPHKSVGPDIDVAGNVVGEKLVGDVHSTWTVVQDHPAADEPFVTRAAGATPESFALTVNANSIVTTSFTLLNRGYLPIHYGKGTVATNPATTNPLDLTVTPYIHTYNPLGNYPSISSATSRCAMYMNGIPKCVKDIAININGLSEAIYCVGDIGPTGATYNDMRPEVKATLYFSENIEIMNAIYNFASGTWSQINFTAQVGDTLGNVYCITVMNASVTGDMPKVGKGVAEIQVSGKAGRFEDTAAIAAGAGVSVTEEMLPWIIQVDVMPKFV